MATTTNVKIVKSQMTMLFTAARRLASASQSMYELGMFEDAKYMRKTSDKIYQMIDVKIEQEEEDND